MIFIICRVNNSAEKAANLIASKIKSFEIINWKTAYLKNVKFIAGQSGINGKLLKLIFGIYVNVNTHNATC